MGANALGARRFRRVSDGVLGLGFYINWAGLQQASVSWPDIPAVRYVPDDFERKVVEDLGEVKVCDESCVVLNHQSMITRVNLEPYVDKQSLAEYLSEQTGREILPEDIESVRAVKDESNSESPSLDVEPSPMAKQLANELSELERVKQETGLSTEQVLNTVAESPRASFQGAVEDYLAANPGVAIAQVVEHLATIDIEVTAAQVASVRERMGLVPADTSAESTTSES